MNDKENNVTVNKKLNNTRKSFGTARQVLNTSGFLKMTDKEDSIGLNDKFNDYIEYVRSVEDLNETLKKEKQNLIDSYDKDLNNIKSTYGSEIDSLRKALDDIATSKSTLSFENESLVEETDKLQTKLTNNNNALIVLRKEYSELQENLISQRKKSEKYEILKQEHDELLIEHSNNLRALKNEICKRAELENRVITLSEDVEFHKKVNSNAKSNFESKIVNVQNSMAENIDMKINEKVELIRLEMSEEFEQCKENLESMYEEKMEKLTSTNEKLSSKFNTQYNELKGLKRKAEDMNNEIVEKDGQISILNNRISSYIEWINQLNNDHENYLKEIKEEKQSLEVRIMELTDEINEKAAIEKNLYMFESMLESEKNRCNISDIQSPKRRKRSRISTSEHNFEVVASSKERVKLFCDDSYNGKFIQLMNDSEIDVNINEWKIEMTTESKNEIYCFPNRFIKNGSILRVWTFGEQVDEDENNTVMNVDLPLADYMDFKLTNDMDEIEAHFEMKKVAQKRKFLKAHMKPTENKKECIIM